jgi:RNA polymerase sigma factor (sigma-70 family)
MNLTKIFRKNPEVRGYPLVDSTRLSLIEGLQKGNRDAWERFALSYQAKVSLWVFHNCQARGLPNGKSRELAEEVTQELLIAIREKVQSFDLAKRRLGGFRAWLKMTTRNLLVSYVRRNAKHWGSGDSAILERLLEEPAKAVLESEIDKEFERQILTEAMQELRDASPNECALVDDLGWGDRRCKDSASLSAAEVARRHGATASAVLEVKSRLKKSLKEKVSRKRKLMG